MKLTGKRHPFLARFEVGFDDDGALRARRDRAVQRRRLVARPERAGARPRAVPPRQLLLHAARGRGRAASAHAPRLAHRVPRLRRPAGHARDRGDPRSRRAARSVCRRTSCASATSTGERRTRRTTARRSATPSASRASGPSCRRRASFERALGRDRRVQRGAAAHVKRGLAITPVKFGISFTDDVPQPGRRARARLPRRQRAGEPRRHRDGAGPAHEDRWRSPRDELGPADRRDPRDADAHRQGAEHLGHGGVERLRPERRGGAARVRDAARAARRGSPPMHFAVRAASAIVFAGRRASIRAASPSAASRSRRSSNAGLPGARAAVRDRLLPHAGHRTTTAKTGQGKPFHYFAYGAAVSEVEVDGFTGQNRVLARRHPARRRRLAVPAGRPRPDRGRLRAGRGLAHRRGAGLGRGRARSLTHGATPTRSRRSASARRILASRSSSAPPSPASSTAARPSASRR